MVDYATFWRGFMIASRELPLLAGGPMSSRNYLAISVGPGVRVVFIVNSREGPAGVEVVFDSRDEGTNREHLTRMKASSAALEDTLDAALAWNTEGKRQHMSWWFDAPSVTDRDAWPTIYDALRQRMLDFYPPVRAALVAEGIIEP